MSDEAIEKEIQEKGLIAPRITPQHVQDQIINEVYLHPGRDTETLQVDDDAPLSVRSLACLTICVLVLKNGFTVVGKSACASPENFDLELGRKIARKDAEQHIWGLEGYQLRTQLANAAA